MPLVATLTVLVMCYPNYQTHHTVEWFLVGMVFELLVQSDVAGHQWSDLSLVGKSLRLGMMSFLSFIYLAMAMTLVYALLFYRR